MPFGGIIAFSYIQYNREISAQIRTANFDVLSKSAGVVDNIINGIEDLVARFSASPETVCYLEIHEDYDSIVCIEDARAIIESHIGIYPYFNDIFIYSEHKRSVLSTYGERNAAWYANTDKWYRIHKHFKFGEPYNLVSENNGNILFCYPLPELGGLVVFDVSTAQIGGMLDEKDVPSDRSFFITKIDGSIMYTNTGELFETDGRLAREMGDIAAALPPDNTRFWSYRGTKVLSSTMSAHKSWKYMLMTDLPLYEEHLSKTRDFLYLSALFALLSGLLATYLITLRTYRPVKKIIGVIEKPGLYLNGGALGGKDKNEELLYITGHILKRVHTRSNYENEFMQRMKLLDLSQTQALQYQMNPHFLYNTFEMLKWLSNDELGFGNRLSSALTKIAKFYRTATEGNKILVRMADEISFLKLYIDILNIRYNKSVDFIIQMEDSLKDFMVLKLIIQPIVENAVKHGLRPKGYRGTVKISVVQEGETLKITIEDDGVYITEREIELRNAKLRERNTEAAAVGLNNVNTRIKLVYGDSYGITLKKPGEDPGLIVEMLLPAVLYQN